MEIPTYDPSNPRHKIVTLDSEKRFHVDRLPIASGDILFKENKQYFGILGAIANASEVAKLMTVNIQR